MASFEEDIFTAIKANWTADSLSWGSAGEGTPKVRGVIRHGSDEVQPEPYASVRVVNVQRIPTCAGDTRWSGVAEIRVRFLPGTQMPSTNYAGLRDPVVARIISQLDDAQLTASGGTHTLGRGQVIGAIQNSERETTIRLAVYGEGS